MGDQRALTDGTGGVCRGTEEELAIPRGGRPIGPGWMSGWVGRLAARTQRRGSLGFTDGGLSTPPARLGSQDDHWEGWEAAEGQEEGRPLSKLRNESFPGSLLSSTPGGDGDQYHFKQRFSRRKDSEPSEVAGLVAWEGEHHHVCPQGVQMPTLQEGIAVTLATSREECTVSAGCDPLRGLFPPTSVTEAREETEDTSGSIFLIDLEDVKTSDGKTHLKPKSKKFTAASLLGGKLTQNWFFRKDDDELDNLVDEAQEAEDEDRSRKSSKQSTTSISSTESNGDQGRSTVLKKLKSLTERNSWREVNFGAPQGT